MSFWGTLPQWITAIIALAAAAVAVFSIKTQREIARKRAAMDFFTKTEMDKNTLDQHRDYKNSLAEFENYKGREGGLASFATSTEYWKIRDYLNLHELMSVGIKLDVFDDNVCYDFWSGELARACRDTDDLVSYIQALPGEAETYCELRKVQQRWAEKDAKQNRSH